MPNEFGRITRDKIVEKYKRHSLFGPDDIGLTNPRTDAYVKLSIDGVVEVYAGNGTGIFLNPNTRTVTIVADKLNFVTSSKDSGIKWNDCFFNARGTVYTEPFLVDEESHSGDIDLFYGVDEYLEEEDEDNA